MDWLAIRTWTMANLRKVALTAGIILVSGYILFGGNSSDANIPGIDIGTLLISAALFWFANKVGSTTMGGKVIGTVAILLLIAGTYPIIFYLLDKVGLAPDFILVLATLAGIWVWKKGNGFFFWRLGLFLYLVAAVINIRGGVINDSVNAFLSSTGIEFKMPNIKIPQVIKNIAAGLSSSASSVSAQKISQSKERMVKNGAKFYNYDGAKFAERKSPDTKDKFIKVFILDEQVTKDGLTFEKVRIGDPATGEDAWVYSGILLTSPTASAPKADPTATIGWEKVEEKVVDFSKLKIESFDQKLSFPVIPISLNKKMEAGNYRIRLSGNWIFFMSSGNWKQFPWQGKTYANNLPEYRPDKGKEFCAIILLNNGEDITPVNKEGFILSSQGSVNLSLKINVLMRVDEFYSERIIDRANKLTLSNSEKEPVTITIEKEVKS